MATIVSVEGSMARIVLPFITPTAPTRGCTMCDDYCQW